jgi:hypothetical protein
MNDTSTETDLMKNRWVSLVRDIAAKPYRKGPKGRLVVIGSGMSFIDFTRDSDDEIRSADYVFHCLYDKVTQAWIGRIRPDSYDIRILYRPNIDRYWIYVQMAEALLHYVRLGKKVVAVYYGHPGIFAMPAHRAIHIARAEGHEALMRPGISALDYLVADVGFDPSLPGLQSFEATDMLLRQRRIDPTLHVVLWQVGVVGEFQYDPHGFENKGFDLLVRTLTEVYGPDWDVIHYIAPQYVGVEPLIDRIPISQLLEPAVRERISSLSTFYIEPKVGVVTDVETSAAMGRPNLGQEPEARRTYSDPGYGNRELGAIATFPQFKPSDHYNVTPYSRAAEFMLALSRDLDLQARYRADPAAVVADPQFGLGERARQLLAIPHPKAIDAALREGEPSPEPG